METRHAVLWLVVVVTTVMLARGAVALQNGAYGTVGRQLGVGAIVLIFGLALVRNWDQVGR